MTIRQATVDDTPALVRMTGNFLAGTSYGAILRFNPEAIAHLVARVLDAGVIFLALTPNRCPRTWPDVSVALLDFKCRRCGQPVRDHQPQPIGFIAVAALESPISGEVYAEELAWWVEPAHRNGRAGPYLLRSAEDWSRQKSIDVLKMVAPSGSDVGTFYERLGYLPIETAYLKRL